MSVLNEFRVVDFSRIFAGPFASQLLADMGADVVKIERIDGGDEARHYGAREGDRGLSGSFVAFNRNKRSLAVDMSTPAGREVVHRLISRSDVVLENFRDGVMRSWGMDYSSLAEVNPRLIYCAISAFGRVGPLASKAGNDLIIQAYSGLLSFQGEPGRPPVRCATSIADLSTGLYAALGVLGALLHRAGTGQGQLVETSLLESQVSIMSYFLVDYWLKGAVPRPMGTANSLGAPNQAFPTNDGWIVVAATNERMWQRCCEALGAAELAVDHRFDSLPARHAHYAEMVEELEQRTSQMATADCIQALEAQGVSCAPIQTIPQVCADEQLGLLGAFVEVPTGAGGTARVVGNPLHFSATPVSHDGAVPLVGQNTDDILAEIGYTPDEIQQLAQTGTVARAQT